MAKQISWLGQLLSLIAPPLPTAPPESVLREAAGVTVDADDDQWRRLDGGIGRELEPISHRRMQERAVYLWQANPIANRLIELPLAFLLADGVKLESETDDEDIKQIVQDVLDRFWTHPTNCMPLKLPKFVRELALFGCQCWPTFVNPMNGVVRLGYLDPGRIETVVMDPDNACQPIGIVTRRNSKGEQKRFRVIVNGPEADLFTARTIAIRETFADGDAFYFCVNALAQDAYGRSDLLHLIDWCDTYETGLLGENDRQAYLRAFLWDVTLAGATPEDVAKRAREISPPSPGSVRVHNDRETWQALSPDLKASDGAEGARLFRNHILGGLTLPEHWFGGGGDVNRSTGDSMSEPTFKVLSMRQALIGYMLEELGRYVIRQYEMANGGREPDLFDPVFKICAKWPEMIVRDTTKYAAALQQTVVAAQMAITAGVLSKGTALELIESIAARLGVPFDAEEELAKSAGEAAAAAEADVFQTPPDPTGDRAAQAA